MKFQNKKRNKTNGITLIALVVTIVILIILATISINSIFGENGLIKKTEVAKDFHEQAKEEEQTRLDNVADYMGDYLNGYGGGNTGPEMPSAWDKAKVTVIDDGKGNSVPLPNNFYYVGGNIDTGIVISDKPGDTMDSSGTEMGNQFVWIPVASESDFERTEFDSSGQPTTSLDAKYTEPCTSGGYPTEVSEYNTMRTQVLKYGGFYIGRFEAGVNSTTLRTGVTTAQTVVCKKGVAPYNYEPWGKSFYGPGEEEEQSGAAYLAKNMYTASNSVTSTLCYGSQWDAMCRYIGDSQRTTPKKSAIELTGSVPGDVSKNIYDLAGNCWEWTMEVRNNSTRVIRGGVYNSAGPVSGRQYNPTSSNERDAFRCTLYIK